MSNLIDHARRELELCGQFEEDPAFAVAVLAAVSAFDAYPGHSGGSAGAGISMLRELLQFQNLSPLTNDPTEWQEHSALQWNGKTRVWQNRRNSKAFSEDGGLTYWLVGETFSNEEEKTLYRTRITHDNSGNVLQPLQFKEDYEMAVEEPVNGCAETLTNQPVDGASEVRVRRIPNGSGYDEVPMSPAVNDPSRSEGM